MLDFDNVEHYPIMEQIVDVICNQTQNSNRTFFRPVVAYFLGKMASSMRATIITEDRGPIPVNNYVIALAESGFGKGHSVHILEDKFTSGFRRRYLEDTFTVKAEQHLWKLALERAAISGKDEDDEKKRLDKEFLQAGAMAFTFDSGTAPAIKQLRQKLLLSATGSINFQMDEIGSNLVGNTEPMNVYLELYDQGLVKQKLTKNTADNTRNQEVEGKTPANFLGFGTNIKLLDGGPTEDAFFSLLETGFARRSIFAWGESPDDFDEDEDLEVAYDKLTSKANTQTILRLAHHFTLLADESKHGWEMTSDRTIGIELLRYKRHCEKLARGYPQHEAIRKAEMSHRYFKALKLAGTFAFIDESSEITLDHLHAAMKLVEESGLAFQRIMKRERAYVKLARYITTSGLELTHADLVEQLPFYPVSGPRRTELMTLAMAHAYKNHGVIRKSFDAGIEFFTGETLEETDLNKLVLSWSDHFANDYEPEEAPFDGLEQLVMADGLHWCNHVFKDGHRSAEDTIPGFNMVVLDCDGDVPISVVHELLAGYKFATYTTKRHTDEVNRFRVILPINYKLHLDRDDYKLFMNGIMEYMPFLSDEGANQRERKWETYPNGTFTLHDGEELFDCLPFIPKTSGNERHQAEMLELGSLDNLERWFAQRMQTGSRNNEMIKFALALVDSKMSYAQIESTVLNFNAKLANGLSIDEIKNTIMQTVAKKLS